MARGGVPHLAPTRLVAVRPDTDDARRLVARLRGAALVERRDLVGVHGPLPGSGRSDGEFWEHDGWFLKSRGALVFAADGEAMVALERAHAKKRELGELTPRKAVLALVVRADGKRQVWSIAPRLTTLRERLNAARAAGAWEELRRALVAFAHALGATVGLSLARGLLLDANPANFAVQGGRVRYIDDDVAASQDAHGVEDAFLGRFGEYAGVPDAVWEAYARRFADELRHAAGDDGLRALRLPARLRAAAQLRRGAEPWAERLLARLEQREPG
jgi:hypothetical protein